MHAHAAAQREDHRTPSDDVLFDAAAFDKTLQTRDFVFHRRPCFVAWTARPTSPCTVTSTTGMPMCLRTMELSSVMSSILGMRVSVTILTRSARLARKT